MRVEYRRWVATVAVSILTCVISPAPSVGAETLKDARAAFQTTPQETDYRPSGELKPPAYKAWSLVKYPSSVGELGAYLSRGPTDGRKHPCVVWAHGGFGSIDPEDLNPHGAANDQSPDAFRAAGFVVLYPSWRGENNNPGKFELFYGETDDLIAAVEYARHLPDVDPDRIYLMGHSSGGALVLEAVEMGVNVRAAFSFGGTTSIGGELKERNGAYYQYKHVPFDWHNEQEVRLRSPVNFVESIQVPTLYVEGERVTVNVRGAQEMAKRAAAAHVPLTVAIMNGANHFSDLRPLKRLLIEKLQADDGHGPFKITVTPEEVNDAFTAMLNAKPRVESRPFAKVTPEVLAWWKSRLDGMRPKFVAGTPVFVRLMTTPDDTLFTLYDLNYDVGDVACDVGGIQVVVDPHAFDGLIPIEVYTQPGPPTGGGGGGAPKIMYKRHVKR